METTTSIQLNHLGSFPLMMAHGCSSQCCHTIVLLHWSTKCDTITSVSNRALDLLSFQFTLKVNVVGTVLSLGAYLGLVVLILDSYPSLCRLVLAY